MALPVSPAAFAYSARTRPPSFTGARLSRPVSTTPVCFASCACTAASCGSAIAEPMRISCLRGPLPTSPRILCAPCSAGARSALASPSQRTSAARQQVPAHSAGKHCQPHRAAARRAQCLRQPRTGAVHPLVALFLRPAAVASLVARRRHCGGRPPSRPWCAFQRRTCAGPHLSTDAPAGPRECACLFRRRARILWGHSANSSMSPPAQTRRPPILAARCGRRRSLPHPPRRTQVRQVHAEQVVLQHAGCSHVVQCLPHAQHGVARLDVHEVPA